MTNYSIYEQNVFDAFHGVSDDLDAICDAMAVYLRHVEDRGRLGAERLALEYLKLQVFTAPFIKIAASSFRNADIPVSVGEFVRDRWYHWRFPMGKNGKTPFAPHRSTQLSTRA